MKEFFCRVWEFTPQVNMPEPEIKETYHLHTQNENTLSKTLQIIRTLVSES